MARPERYNVDYFPHYIGDGKKIFYIEQKYGNDGYATWFKILEILARTNHHYIDLRNKTEVMYLAAKCRIKDEILLNILSDLAIFGKIDEDLWRVKIIYSSEFMVSIQDAYEKRKNKPLPKTELMDTEMKLTGEETELITKNHPDNTQSKVKETKVNQSKVVNMQDSEIFTAEIWPTFDDFWNAYDKKVDKPKVEKLWLKLKQAEKEQIMQHVPEYVRSEPDKQFRKNPQTYLNSKSYENEIISKNTGGGGTATGFAQDLAEHIANNYGNNQGGSKY